MSDLLVAGEVRLSGGLTGEAVLVEDGLVAAVGDAADLRRSGATEHRYTSGTVIPGLVDAHLHPLGYTAVVTRLNLDRASCIDDVLALVADAVATAGDRSVVGSRLDDQSLVEGRLPTRADLDGVTGDTPVLLYRYCGHVAVANTAALTLAGITHDTPDPAAGSFDRDGRGVPTGILRETAVGSVSRVLGGRAGDLTPGELLAAMEGLTTLGLSALGAIIDLTGDLWCGIGNELDLLLEVAADLPIRMQVLPITNDPGELERAAARLRNAGPMVEFLGIKQFGDGSFGGHTAAMREPFADKNTTGTLRIDENTALMARAALRLGGSVAVHAIGDRANAEVLSLFEELADEGADPGALRIEHASVLRDDDLARFAAGGFTGVIQPAFLMSEAGWLEDRMGAGRMGQTYAFRRMLDAGIPLAGSSDCPVEPPSPFWGMAAAVDRAGVMPTEALSSLEALDLFTGGARRACSLSQVGIGSPADLTVMDCDPATATASGLRSAKTVATWLDGKPVRFPSNPLVWEPGNHTQ